MVDTKQAAGGQPRAIGGRVFRESTYWAQVLEAPPWRREWVELMEDDPKA